MIFVAPPDREARLESRELPGSATRIADRANAGGLDGILARVSLSLDKVEHRQTAALTDLEEQIDTKARRMRSVLTDLGVDIGKTPANSAMGGPFVPVKPPQSGASAFERQLYRINVARAQIDHYTHTLVAVPVRKPVVGEVDMSSPFGMRMDPFLKGPAIHTGIDLRGDNGDPVRATANGKVTIASWQGGYGNMVEIDHGNGFRHALRPHVGDRRQGRPNGAHRADHRQDRLDRPLHRPASALRDAHRRRGGRSAEIPARRIAAGWLDFGKQYLGRGLSWLRVHCNVCGTALFWSLTAHSGQWPELTLNRSAANGP